MGDIGVEELQSLYQWIDTIPLSRPKRNIARDFSDGVLCAEVVNHYLPKIVELHNYSSASSITQKIYNWETLNSKCLKKIGVQASRADFEAVSNCVPGSIEKLLQQVQVKIARYHSKAQGQGAGGPGSQLSGRGADRQRKAERDHRSGSGSGSGSGARHRSEGPARKAHHDHPTHSHGHGHEGSRSSGGPSSPHVRELHSKDRYIQELKEANDILDTKVRKLEQLVRLKDAKIQTLQAKLQAVGLEGATRIYS